MKMIKQKKTLRLKIMHHLGCATHWQTMHKTLIWSCWCIICYNIVTIIQWHQEVCVITTEKKSMKWRITLRVASHLNIKQKKKNRRNIRETFMTWKSRRHHASTTTTSVILKSRSYYFTQISWKFLEEPWYTYDKLWVRTWFIVAKIVYW